MTLATLRVTLFGLASPLATPVLAALRASTSPRFKLRLAARWDELATQQPLPNEERVLIEPSQPATLQSALRATNYAIVLHEPGPEMGREVLLARELLTTARQAGVERLVWTSCASMLAPDPLTAAHRLATGSGAYMPGSGSALLDSRYAVELEVSRVAADAMNVVLLNPALLLDPQDVALHRALRALNPHQPLCGISPHALGLAHLRALTLPPAGARYPLGEANGTARDVQSTPVARLTRAADRLRELTPLGAPNAALHPRYRALLEHSAHLQISAASQALDLALTPSLAALWQRISQENA